MTNFYSIRFLSFALVLVFMFISSAQSFAEELVERLNNFAKRMEQLRPEAMGYPVNQNTDLKEFYEWYYNSKLYEVALNNVGDPQQPSMS